MYMCTGRSVLLLCVCGYDVHRRQRPTTANGAGQESRIKINNKLRIQRKSTDNDAINEHQPTATNQTTTNNPQKGKLPRLTGCPSSNDFSETVGLLNC